MKQINAAGQKKKKKNGANCLVQHIDLYIISLVLAIQPLELQKLIMNSDIYVKHAGVSKVCVVIVILTDQSTVDLKSFFR